MFIPFFLSVLEHQFSPGDLKLGFAYRLASSTGHHFPIRLVEAPSSVVKRSDPLDLANTQIFWRRIVSVDRSQQVGMLSEWWWWCSYPSGVWFPQMHRATGFLVRTNSPFPS